MDGAPRPSSAAAGAIARSTPRGDFSPRRAGTSHGRTAPSRQAINPARGEWEYHEKATKEALGCLSWLVTEPPAGLPKDVIEPTIGGSDFWANKARLLDFLPFLFPFLLPSSEPSLVLIP